MILTMQLILLFLFLSYLDANALQVEKFKKLFSMRVAQMESVAISKLPFSGSTARIHPLLQNTKASFFQKVDTLWEHQRLSKRNSITSFHLQLQNAWNQSVSENMNAWVKNDLIPIAKKLDSVNAISKRSEDLPGFFDLDTFKSNFTLKNDKLNPNHLVKRMPPLRITAPVRGRITKPVVSRMRNVKPKGSDSKSPKSVQEEDVFEDAVSEFSDDASALTSKSSHSGDTTIDTSNPRTWGQFGWEMIKSPFDFLAAAPKATVKESISDVSESAKTVALKTLKETLDSSEVKESVAKLQKTINQFIDQSVKQIEESAVKSINSKEVTDALNQRKHELREGVEKNINEFLYSNTFKKMRKEFQDASDDYIKQTSKQLNKELNQFLNSKPIRSIIIFGHLLVFLILASIGMNMWLIFNSMQ